MGFFKDPADGLAALDAIVESEIIHIHSDEAIDLVYIQAAGKLNGVIRGFLTMIESVLDAFANILSDLLHHRAAEIALDDIAAERKRQTGALLPPFTQIQDLM